MKQVKFRHLGMKNFCNHIEPVEINFVDGQLILVTGPNGSGKTSMFQALPYVLYGVCEKGRGEDVLNDKTKKNCHVWVEFTVGDDVYRVDRYVKFTRLGNTVTLKKNDVVTHKGHKEVLPEIEKLLVPYKLFTNTLLFGQKVKTFFTDLKDSEQKEIFRKILKLGDYVMFHQQAGRQVKDVENDIQVLVNDISVSTSLITQTASDIERQKELQKEFEQHKDEALNNLKTIKSLLITKIHDLEDKIKESDGFDTKMQDVLEQLAVVNNELDSIESEKKAERDKIETRAQATLAGMEKDAQEAKTLVLEEFQLKRDEISEHYNAQLKDVDEEVKLLDADQTELLATIASQESEIKGLEDRSNDLGIDSELSVCPTCLQEITKECIGHINDKIAGFDKQIDALQTCLTTNQKALRENQHRKNECQIKSDDIKKKRNEEFLILKEEEDQKTAGVQERLTAAITKLDAMVVETKLEWTKAIEGKKLTLEKQKDVLSTSKQELQKVLDQRVSFQQELQSTQVDYAGNKEALEREEESEFDKSMFRSLIVKLEELRSKTEEYQTNKETLERELKMVQFWRIGFSPSGIQSMLIDEAIPFMNEKIAEYMYKLSNGRYSVTFDTLKATKAGEFRDKISVEVFDNTTHADARVKLSGGQERIVDIGTILTLCDLQSMIQDVEFNLLLFDEIFDALDDENIGFVANLIKMVSKDKWVGVISHRHIDQIESDEVLSFRG